MSDDELCTDLHVHKLAQKVAELEAEIGRLRGNLDNRDGLIAAHTAKIDSLEAMQQGYRDEVSELRIENERLRGQNAVAATFLDGLASNFTVTEPKNVTAASLTHTAADCHAMAERLRR